jgi:hypothetical protein
MIGAEKAFHHFQLLVSDLRQWGFDVHQSPEFGEFSINQYVCSYRYFGVLDIDFLLPGQRLSQRCEPDWLLGWDGNAWREISQQGVSEVQLSNAQLFNRCLKRVNYQVAASLGFSPNMCIRA